MILLAAVDESRVTPGLLGFGVTMLLVLATWLLLRSMNRHLKRVNIPDEQPPAGPPPGRRPQAPPAPADDPGSPGR